MANTVQGNSPARCFSVFNPKQKGHTTRSKVNEQTYLTVREVSDYLGVSQTAVYELTHSQDFPVFRIGSRVRIPKEAFLAWVDMKTHISPNLRSYMASL